MKWLVSGGWEVHRARVITFTTCAGLVLLAVAVAFMPSADVRENGFWSPISLAILAMLLCVAAGTLGLYPNYYSFSQELTRKHQGKISGALGTIAWIGSGTMQWFVGRNIDVTKSYATAVGLAGILPIFAVIALWLFWPRRAVPALAVMGADESVAPGPDLSTAIKHVDDRIREG